MLQVGLLARNTTALALLFLVVPSLATAETPVEDGGAPVAQVDTADAGTPSPLVTTTEDAGVAATAQAEIADAGAPPTAHVEIADAGPAPTAHVEIAGAGPAPTTVAEPTPTPVEPVATPTEPAATTPSKAEPPKKKGFVGIRGTFTDEKTGEPLIEATVQLTSGGTKKAKTDVDGHFEMKLQPGTYDLRVYYPLYIGRKVGGVVVEAGQATQLDLKLKPDEKNVQEVHVTAKADTRWEAAVLQERKRASVVQDSISAQEIARSPDSNASDAVKRVVSATIQDSRYIVIRGLGGRYGLVLMNGVTLPSPDPDVPAAPLDLFPTALLANLTVAKTFSPDMPGNFAGGALSIGTRTLPESFTLKLKLGTGGNTVSTFRPIQGYAGGKLDWLGYDDGTRALPQAIPRKRLAGDASLSEEQVNKQAQSFPNNWKLQPKAGNPLQSFAATVGDTFKFGNQRLGYLASMNYGHAFVRRRSHIARVGEDDGKGGRAPSVLQLDEEQGTEQASLAGLAAVGYTPANGQQFNLVSIYTHTADSTGSSVRGIDNSTVPVDRIRLRFLEREMLLSQLVGEHALFGGGATLGWQGNIARVSQNEPDTRDLLRSQVPDGRFTINRGSGSAERLYSTLSDVSGGGGLDVTVPFSPVKLKAGGAFLHTQRSYQARRFHFDVLPRVSFLPPEQAFDSKNMGSSTFFSEMTVPSDGYAASRDVTAAYLMADIVQWDPFRAVVGARFEQSDLSLGLNSRINQGVEAPPPTKRTDRSILPSVSLVYALSKESNLRGAYTMTVARPNFREISPALYFDYVRRRAIGGNPKLLETKIHNADLRWEYFFGPTEVLAASVFYKHFINPIERTVEDASDGQNVGFDNAKAADVYGLELESRVSLGRLTPVLSPLSLGANLSLINSRIDIPGAERPLQGQSPFVANADLNYDLQATGTQVGLRYNVFGARIEEVGTGGAGNIQEEPFHRLDFTFSQRLPGTFRLKAAASNLLNQRVVFTQSRVEILAYQVGLSFQIALEMNIE